MRLILLLFIFLFISSNATGQQLKEAILRDAEIYNKAFMDENFEKMVAYTVPSVVKIGGGAELMVDVEKDKKAMYESQGAQFISILPLAVDRIVEDEGYYQAILTQEVVMSIADSRFKRNAYYLAVSQDVGETWTFVDLEPFTTESIKTYVPYFSDKLEVPTPDLAEIIKQ